MLPPVVAGVDGSEESLAAAEWAAREAARRQRPLRLVHAGDSRPRHGAAGRPADPARHALHRARAAAPTAVVSAEEVRGPAVPALLKEAADAEVTVLGSRGLSGFTGFLVGSVALGTAARATRPVVLVRAGEDAADEHLPGEDGAPSTTTGYRDVVLAVDVREPCDEVLEFAFEAARLRQARLRVVYAWQTPGPLSPGPGEAGLLPEYAHADEWLGFLSAVLRVWRDKYPDVQVMETVVADRPANALVRASTGASLLVVGRRVTEHLAGPRTGPVTHAAVHHVGCPVAVVPHY